MAWANPNNQYQPYDMDSSDGNDAKKLRVRNNVAAPAQTHRVEIAERAHPLSPHQALKINGDTQIDYYGDDNQDHRAGSITPEPAGLFINAQTDEEAPANGDPDVTIGWSRPAVPESLGNIVWLRGKQVSVGGAAPGSNAVSLQHPVGIPGVDSIDGQLVVEGRILARNLDANLLPEGQPSLLGIGRDNATKLDVADDGILTEVHGSFRVNEDTEFHGDVDFWAGANVSNLLDVNGIVRATDLDVNGSGDIAENLTVNGELNRPNIFKATATDVQIQAATTVIQSTNGVSSLYVKHGSASATKPALDAVSVSSQPAIRGTGTIALTTSGRAEMGGELRMNNNTLYLGGITAQGTGIRANGSTIEFLIGGVVKFYIDSTGGHNA